MGSKGAWLSIAKWSLERLNSTWAQRKMISIGFPVVFFFSSDGVSQFRLNQKSRFNEQSTSDDLRETEGVKSPDSYRE